jgi:hypothetical protein
VVVARTTNQVWLVPRNLEFDMIYRGQPLRRLARFLNRIVWLSAGWYVALVAPLVALADDSDTLQKQAIQRIDHYRDYARHTGDVGSLQLQRAQGELTVCANTFLANKNVAGAVLSYIKLGDIERPAEPLECCSSPVLPRPAICQAGEQPSL